MFEENQLVDTDDRTELSPEEIPETLRKYTTAIIESQRGIFLNPEFVGREHIATALQLLTHHDHNVSSNACINTGNYPATIEFIPDHEKMPAKVTWAARIHIDGLNEPLWATRSHKYGVEISDKPEYWITKRYQKSLKQSV